MSTRYSALVYAGIPLKLHWCEEVHHHIKRCGKAVCVLPERTPTDAERFCSFCGMSIAKVKIYLDLAPFPSLLQTSLRENLGVPDGRVYKDNFLDNAQDDELFPGMKLHFLYPDDENTVFFGTAIGCVGQHEGDFDDIEIASWKEKVWRSYCQRTGTKEEPQFLLRWRAL